MSIAYGRARVDSSFRHSCAEEEKPGMDSRIPFLRTSKQGSVREMEC